LPTELDDDDLVVREIAELERYRRLQQTLDKAMPWAIVTIDTPQGPKRWRKTAHWSALARVLGVHVELEHEERIDFNGAWGMQVIYRASLGSRSETGDGACTAGELRVDGTYHGIRNRAHQRGRNRAIANLVGFGDPAEADELEYHPERNESPRGERRRG